MLSDTNKLLYKKILEKEYFINMMLINKRLKLIMMVLDDDFYKFNSLFQMKNKNIFYSKKYIYFFNLNKYFK